MDTDNKQLVTDTYTVLLVEDDDVDAGQLRRTLARSRSHHFEVTHVGTAGEGRRCAADGLFDAIIVDLSLPDAEGLENVRSVLSVAPDAAVVVLTGRDDNELPLAAIRTGAQDYLRKDGPDETIERSIRYSIDRKRREVEGRRVDRRLWEIQKLESLGLLAGGVAHDFNNLLTGILGGASLCKDMLPPDSKLVAHLELVETSAVRASELCAQLLAYSGRGRFEVQDIDLSELVRELLDMLRMSIGDGPVLRLELAEGLPSLRASGTQVRQIVMNLITNAADAVAGRAGQIEVRTGVISCDQAYLDARPFHGRPEPGDYIFVEVRDDGVGMDRAAREQLFQPFFSTKGQGRGLGLAAVLGIASAHGAAVEVESELGKGSRLRVLFPAASVVEKSEGRVLSPGIGGGSGADERLAGRVLVVDDESAVRMVAGGILSQLGLEVVEARDGVEALAIASRDPGGFTMALIDMSMPRMGGEETFRRLRSLHPQLPVILSSGFTDPSIIGDLAADGPTTFLPKPYRVQALIEAIHETVRGDR